MMRKDVKLGFAIGGVLLAVLVVYVLVGTGGGDQSPNQPGGAGIVTEDTSGKSNPANGNSGATGTSGLAQNTTPGSTPPTIRNTPANTGSITGGPTTAPSGELANASDAKNGNGSSSQRDPNKDLWTDALNEGKLLISQTPDVPGGAMSNNSNVGPSGTSPNTPDLSNNAVPPRATPAIGTQDIRGTSSNTGTLAMTDNSRSAMSDPTTRPSDTMRTSGTLDGIGSGGSTSGTSGASNSTPSIAREHVIQRGETLTAISQMAYGNPNLYPAILRANPNLNPNKMRPGTTIVIPAIDAEPASATMPPSHDANTANTASVDSSKEYRVQANDSLYKIAMKLYGKPDMVQKLYEHNRETIGPDPARLKLNMVLKLPEAPSHASR